MSGKRAQAKEAAQQTFRQFAWNLAGTLAKAPSVKPTPTRPAGKRA